MKRLPGTLSLDSIKKVWSISRDATPSTEGAAGIDGIRASVFSSNLDANIHDMRNAIRTGIYRFSRLRGAPVPKATLGYRIIAVPTVRDRLLQRAILRHLEATPKFSAKSEISYGFTKQRTLADAQRRALSLRESHGWVLQADIVKFFDRIPRKAVKSLILQQVGWKLIAELLCSAVDCELDEGNQATANIAYQNGIRKGLGLRQGMPVSPMLSNLILKRFDESLIKRGIIAIRYADDIAVFGKNRNDCSDALDFIRDKLADLDLEIPDLEGGGKTSICGPSEIVQFLGVEIRRFDNGYKLRAPAKKLEKIESVMAEATSIDNCIRNHQNIGHVVRMLGNL